MTFIEMYFVLNMIGRSI